jgi:glycopeptide antibiotics resistance protein
MIRLLSLTLPMLEYSIPIGLVLSFIIVKVTKKDFVHGVFYFYLINVIYICFFARHMSYRRIDLMPFSTLKDSLNNIVYYLENIIMFAPLGLFLVLLEHYSFKKSLLICFLSSLSIEVLQYVFAVGLSQTDDVIANTLGGLVGIGLASLIRRFGYRRKD